MLGVFNIVFLVELWAKNLIHAFNKIYWHAQINIEKRFCYKPNINYAVKLRDMDR
jgi:hypothetical protein